MVDDGSGISLYPSLSIPKQPLHASAASAAPGSVLPFTNRRSGPLDTSPTTSILTRPGALPFTSTAMLCFRFHDPVSRLSRTRQGRSHRFPPCPKASGGWRTSSLSLFYAATHKPSYSFQAPRLVGALPLRACPVLPGCYPPYCGKPCSQWLSAVLKHSAGYHRGLMSTFCAFI